MSESAGGPWYAVFAYHVNRLFVEASSSSSSFANTAAAPPATNSNPRSLKSSLSSSLPTTYTPPPTAGAHSMPSLSLISAAAAGSASGSTSGSTNGGGGGVNEFLRKQATASDEFSLSITRSNMPGERAQMLRAFLIPKLSKGTLYSGTGQTAKIGPSVCYYCLVRNEVDERTKDQRQDEKKEKEDSYFSEEYVVCFVATFPNDDDEGFDLFRQELDDYCKGITSELFAVESHGGDDARLRRLLENWYDVNVEYVSRSISILHNLLDSLLYFILEGRTIFIVGDKKLATDVLKFCAASSILSMLPLPAGAEHAKIPLPFYYFESENTIVPKKPKKYEPEAAILTLTSAGASLQVTISNPFCQEWGRKLTDSQSDIKQMNKGGSTFSASLLLRRIMENCKVKAMQEVNTFKRLVRKAEVDHYSLFACSQYLQGNANRNLLMNVLRNDLSLIEDNPDAVEVLGVLSEFVASSA